MHTLIGIIVYTKNESEALSKARDILNNMTGDDYQPFDWSLLLANPHARWRDDYEPIYNLKDEAGLRVIGELMEATLKAFRYNTQKIIDAIKETNGDIGRLQDYSGFDIYCSWVGQERGSEVSLYDDIGEGIKTRERLKEALDKDTETFLVLADVHC